MVDVPIRVGGEVVEDVAAFAKELIQFLAHGALAIVAELVIEAFGDDLHEPPGAYAGDDQPNTDRGKKENIAVWKSCQLKAEHDL